MKSWACIRGGLALLLLTVTMTYTVQGRRLCFDERTILQLFEELASLSRSCKLAAWPPATPTFHIDGKTHRFVLAFRPVVVPNRKWTNWKSYWLQKLRNLYRGPKPTGSWFRQVVIMQRKLGPKKTGKTQYDFYPPATNVKAIVQAMRKGKPLPLRPYDNPEIQLVRYPTTCSPKDSKTYDLIIGAHSCVRCAWYRMIARRTFMKPQLWKGMRVGFFFMMGMPAPVNRRTINFEGMRVRQRASLPNKKNQAQATRELLKEANRHKDMLIGNYWDEMYNMTLRHIMGFRWASLYCAVRSPLFLFVDPQGTIVPYNVMNFVKSIPAASRPHVYGGRVFYKMRISRAPTNKPTNHPYAVSWNELPWVYYQDFASRIALFLGREQLKDVTVAMAYTKRFRFNDVHIGISFRRLGRAPKHIPAICFSCKNKNTIAAFTHSIVYHINWNTGKVK